MKSDLNLPYFSNLTTLTAKHTVNTVSSCIICFPQCLVRTVDK